MTNIELPYVEKNKSRHGTMRYYLRVDGKRICRLPNDINSEEFARKYWEERNKLVVAPPTDVEKPGLTTIVKPYSFRWLCVQYQTSDAFLRLDSTTQAKRRGVIEGMMLEPLSENDTRLFADIPLSKMTASHIEVLKTRKRDTPFAADERLKALRQVFDTKKDGKQIVPNIAKGVEAYRVHTDGHATATADELAKFLEHHGPQSKAALYLSISMYTGFRVSDLAVLGPQHRKNDEFRLRLFKNRNRTPVDIIIPLHPILKAVLDQHEVSGLVYLQTEFGKPFSVKGLAGKFIHLLYGCYLLSQEGQEIARVYLSGVITTAFPKLYDLLSHFLIGKISLNKQWMKNAFFWEKVTLFNQLTLYYNCLGKSEKAEEFEKKSLKILSQKKKEQ